VPKNRVKLLFFKALHVIISSLVEYSRVLTLACNVAQLRKTWSCITMMIPMLKLHPSSVEVLVVFVITGASVDADLLIVFVILFFQTYESMI
jgi:hypothetical protein